MWSFFTFLFSFLCSFHSHLHSLSLGPYFDLINCLQCDCTVTSFIFLLIPSWQICLHLCLSSSMDFCFDHIQALSLNFFWTNRIYTKLIILNKCYDQGLKSLFYFASPYSILHVEHYHTEYSMSFHITRVKIQLVYFDFSDWCLLILGHSSFRCLLSV